MMGFLSDIALVFLFTCIQIAILEPIPYAWDIIVGYNLSTYIAIAFLCTSIIRNFIGCKQ